MLLLLLPGSCPCRDPAGHPIDPNPELPLQFQSQILKNTQNTSPTELSLFIHPRAKLPRIHWVALPSGGLP